MLRDTDQRANDYGLDHIHVKSGALLIANLKDLNMLQERAKTANIWFFLNKHTFSDPQAVSPEVLQYLIHHAEWFLSEGSPVTFGELQNRDQSGIFVCRLSKEARVPS